MQPAILVVDDEGEFLNTYRRLLGRHGFRVVGADSRASVLSALAREPFALVIADLRLPDGRRPRRRPWRARHSVPHARDRGRGLRVEGGAHGGAGGRRRRGLCEALRRRGARGARPQARRVARACA